MEARKTEIVTGITLKVTWNEWEKNVKKQRDGIGDC